MESLETPEKQLSDEAQLWREGRQLVRRAIELVTQTHKIKVWVPILCSMVLTGYYIYGLHKRQQGTGMDLGPAVTAAPEATREKAADAPVAEPVPEAVVATASATPETADRDASEADLRKQAEGAHAARQFGEEARLWQQFMTRAGLPAQACPAIGRAYERAGEIDLSIQAFEKCMSLQPGNADTAVAFAHVLQTKGDWQRTASLYHAILANDPKNLDAQTGLALLALRQNHLSEAEAGAAGVLRRAPDQTDALLIAGIVAWRESRLPDAERLFLRGAALDDSRADFHAFLGRIAEAERRRHDALEQYDKALQLDPSDAEISGRRERLEQTR